MPMPLTAIPGLPAGMPELSDAQRECLRAEVKPLLISVGVTLAVKVGAAYTGYRLAGRGLLGIAGAIGGWWASKFVTGPLITDPAFRRTATRCNIALPGAMAPAAGPVYRSREDCYAELERLGATGRRVPPRNLWDTYCALRT